MLTQYLEEKDRKSLLIGLARGEYHLLLGAGVSLSAFSSDGQPLPNAGKLANDILEEFKVSTDGEKIDLKRAYEAVENLKDTKGRNRSEYLKARFTNCKPTWHSALAKILWRRIWTLNIDDVIEQAFALCDCRQELKIYNWNSIYQEPERENNELQIIHLHGYAPYLKPLESNIVFSITEYLQVSSKHHAWHRIFGDEYLLRPFIIIGASLVDEFDLAECLRRSNDSQKMTGRPSIIIRPNITGFQRSELQKFGLIPVQAEAQSFFDYINQILPDIELQQASLVPGNLAVTLPLEARTFLRQFRGLSVETSSEFRRSNRDFYQGDDPAWEDIINNLDAKFEIVDRIISEVEILKVRQHGEPYQAVYCIYGPLSCGKSTALLRIGRELISLGFDIFLFQGLEYLDVRAAFWWIQNYTNCILLFDGLSDFSRDIEKLAKKCKNSRNNLLIVSTERESRLSRVYESISPDFLIESKEYRMGELSNLDIDRLINKLNNQRRLGKLTSVSDDARRKYFRKESKRQLLAGMWELERGKGFQFRLVNELKSIKNDLLRVVYELTCMSYLFSYPLPRGIVCVASGVSPLDLTKELAPSGQLFGIVREEVTGLRPHHRVVAKLILEELDKKSLFQISQALAKALSPYITAHTMRQGTITYRIAKEIQDVELVKRWVGIEYLREWYEHLIQEYGWNARFWEQRALAEAELHSFPKARSFAEQAVKLRKDAFTTNTLATILLRMSLDYFEPGSELSKEYFWEGIKNLRESRNLGERKFEHPYITFFTYALYFVREVFKKNAHIIEPRLSREWQDWQIAAEQISIFKHSKNYEKLKNYHHQWLLMAVNNFSM